MKQDTPRIARWKLPVGCAIALAAVLIAPFSMMTSAFMGTPLIALPAIVLSFLYCYGGRRTYIVSMLIQIIGSALLMGSSYMWVVLCAGILPSIVIVRGIGFHRSFGVQLRNGIGASIIGTVAAALLASMLVGGNIIEWLYAQISEALNTMPDFYYAMLSQSFAPLSGEAMTSEQIISTINAVVAGQLPNSKMLFPSALFSGAILNGLFSVYLGNRYLLKRGFTSEECCLPIRDWALPSGMTGGLLLILAISFILKNFDMQNSEAVFYTVLKISSCAFCVHAFGSMARRLSMKSSRRVLRVFVIISLVLAVVFGGAFYIAIYGCISAIFGSRGFMAQKARERNKNGANGSDDGEDDHGDNNDDEDQGGNET